MSEEVKILGAFKYWYETNTEKGVTSIPDYICKDLLDLYKQEKEKNSKAIGHIEACKTNLGNYILSPSEIEFLLKLLKGE